MRTGTPAIPLAVLCRGWQREGNPDREIDSMELGGGRVTAAAAHGAEAAGVLGVGPSSESRRPRPPAVQDPRQLRWKRIRDRCALPAVPVVANLMNGYIEDRGVCDGHAMACYE